MMIDSVSSPIGVVLLDLAWELQDRRAEVEGYMNPMAKATVYFDMTVSVLAMCRIGVRIACQLIGVLSSFL
jgi:hypothetical protein